jgi:dienelactone hydrolase
MQIKARQSFVASSQVVPSTDMQSMISVFLLLLASTTAGYLIPNPPGKYNVTLTTGVLIDYNRSASDAAGSKPREIMLSVFQPATCATTVPVPYMPNKTAEYQKQYLQNYFNVSADLSPLFLQARLPVCPNDADNCSPLEDAPILLFSPGYTGPRLYYSVLASALASEGFMVITIDHPGDANIITYPDGHAVYWNGSLSPDETELISRYAIPRAVDVSFIIDQLSNATAMAELLPQRGHRQLSTDRIAMLGHSLGGSTAVFAAGRDSRIRGAINWDGTIFGELPAELPQPVLLVSSSNRSDASWTSKWPQLTGPKLYFTIANTTHQSFFDALSLMQAAGFDTAPFADLLGTIAPTHLLRLMVAYTTEWMNGAFAGKVGGPLLQGEEPERFPEVSIIMKENF